MHSHKRAVARRWRQVLAIGVAIALEGLGPRSTARAQPPSPRVALVRLMTAPHLRTAWFTPAFLGQVSVAQLEQGRAAVEQALGPFADVRPQPGGSYLLVFRAGVVRTQVALDGQGRIGALGFGSPKPDVNRVDVGGYRLYLQCIGAGSPTVVLEAGLGSPSEVWGLVQPGVARFTRVCAYDRAGVGGSDAGPRPRTSGTIVAALHTLLRRAGVGGPYVLVGHSIGGFHARLYAHRYPREVAGMVLVDASHPDQLARELAALPPYRTGESAALAAVRADLADVRPDPQEGFAWAPSAAQVRASGTLGALPLMVLTRGRSPLPPPFPARTAARLEGVWRALQDELTHLSAHSVHVRGTASGHFIQEDQPALVIAAIRQVVDAARRHAALSPCAPTFPALGGACIR
jgi:pimeloyl-ACP methyl ester carboxylesterase